MTHEKDILVQNQPSVKRRVVNERLTRYFTFTDGFLGVTQRQIAFERLSAVSMLCGVLFAAHFLTLTRTIMPTTMKEEPFSFKQISCSS